MSIAEAMYLGKPVVATAYSGNMDFTAHDNSLLVSYDPATVGPGEDPYDSNTLWAEPELGKATASMRQAYVDSALRSELGARASRLIRQQFSALAVGTMVKNRIRLLAAQGTSREAK
jgi:hypothetical protein